MSKSKTALVAGTGVSLAELASAGISEFKLTKEDLIDLLVAEATASVEAEISAYDEETVVLEAAEKAKHEAILMEVKDWYLAQPAGKAFAEAFPGREIEVHNGTQISIFNKESATFEASLVLPMPAELKSAAGVAYRPYNCSSPWRRLERQKLVMKLDQVEHSTKKLKTQLVRKILSGSENGANVLSNVKGLSAEFLSALTSSQKTH